MHSGNALRDPAVKVLVLRGNGRAFCVGGDADQMLDRAEEDSLARSIAANPQHAVRFFRRAVYQGLNMEMTTHLDMVSSHFAILRDSDDHRAKVREFQARRAKP